MQWQNKTKEQTTTDKALHRKAKIDQHEPHQKQAVYIGAPEE